MQSTLKDVKLAFTPNTKEGEGEINCLLFKG